MPHYTGRSLVTSAAIAILVAHPVQAQSITSATDGTESRVTRHGTRHDIDGGRLSSDGQNLFHSFERFGLSASEIANFMSNPQIQTILGRITGGDASVIDGLIQVTGGNSNLYLINPAGILFGPNARLDLPASFTATTATGIGFGNHWFHAIAPNDYSHLVGNPDVFEFATPQSGVILNAGNLAVAAAQNLTLLGGTVINTGTLTAPGGTITIAAVPGQSRVRIAQEGLLLSVELETTSLAASVNPLPFTPLSLPELLTGGDMAHATGLTVNPDGTVRLTSSNTTIPTAPGTAIASGTLNAAASPHHSTSSPEINVLGDRVALLSATLDVSGVNGGTVRIGGDYQGQGQGQGTVFSGDRTFVSSDSTINANALDAGNGGRIIVWADQTTRFYGRAIARGGITLGNGGFVEISGREFLDFAGQVDLTATHGQTGTLLLDPTNITVVAGANNPPDLPSGGGSQLLFGDNPGGNSTVNNGTINAALADVVLQATNNITFNAPINIVNAGIGLIALANNDIAVNAGITTNGGDLTITGDSDNSGTGAVRVVSPLLTNGGNITINGSNNNGTFNQGSGFTTLSTIDSGGGNISITGTSTSQQGFSLGSGFDRGINIEGNITSDGGAIALTASNIEQLGIVTFNPIDSTGGNITFTVISASNNLISLQNSLNSGSGEITLVADEITIAAPPSVVSGTGTISLQPFTPSRNIAIAGANNFVDNVLDLTTGELSRLSNGFRNIIIGRSDGSGIVTLVNDVTFNDPITLQSTGIGGSIISSGATLSGADNATITLLADQITVSDVTNPGQNIRFTSNGSITTGALSTSSTTGNAGDISLSAVNDITTGAIAANSIDAAGGNIAIASQQGAINTTGGVVSANSDSGNGGNIAMAAAGDISTRRLSTQTFIGTGNRAGNITLNSGGTIRAGTAGDFFADAIEAGSPGDGNHDAGDITFNAENDIIASFLLTRANGVGRAGNVSLNSATGSINITNGEGTIVAFSGSNDAGAVSANALRGAISIDTIVSSTGQGSGGAIALVANNAITTGDLDSRSEATVGNAGAGGAITLTTSNGNIRTGALTTLSRVNSGGNASQGGNIAITAGNGSLNTGQISSISDSVSGNSASPGDIVLRATNDVSVTGDIFADSFTETGTSGSGGTTALTSTNGNIAVSGGLFLGLIASPGSGLLAADALGTVDLSNGIFLRGGDITLGAAIAPTAIVLPTTLDLSNSNVSLTQAGNLSFARPVTTNGGNFSLTSTGTLTVSNSITTNGGNIALRGATINARAANLDSSATGEGGAIRLTASGQTGSVQIGDITLGSTTGQPSATLSISASNAIRINALNTNGVGISFGTGDRPRTIAFLGDINTARGTVGGDLSLLSDRNLTVQNITTNGGTIRLDSVAGAVRAGNLSSSAAQAGNLSILAETEVQVGAINTSGFNQAGDVFIDPQRDVQVTTIDTRSVNGRGGDVDITAGRFFRATGVLGDFDTPTSIATAGRQGNGAIALSHGGNGLTPFNIGNLTDNGTAGAITSGETTLNVPASYPLSYTQGNILIRTTGVASDPVDFVEPEAPISPPITEPEVPGVAINPLNPPDERLGDAVVEYNGLNEVPIRSLAETQERLGQIEQQTGIRPGLVYVFFEPDPSNIANFSPSSSQSPATPAPSLPIDATKDRASDFWHFSQGLGANSTAQGRVSGSEQTARSSDRLQLLLVTPTGQVIRKVVPVTRVEVIGAADQFRSQVSHSGDVSPDTYLPQAQQLYDWLVSPLENDLTAQEIDNLTFIADAGLRSLPFAALHDRQAFLIERYSIGLMPSFSLTNTDYRDIRTTQILAMGASEFQQEAPPLYATPIELANVTEFWGGIPLINETFTLDNLVSQRTSNSFGIVHLATHGAFQSGDLSDSFIQFWDQKLRLDQVSQLQLSDPPVELLVLSACQTALGNEQAELGFAGVAAKTGVKSVLASLWYVSDYGTLALMSEFYRQLRQAPIKAEALRQTQLAMLRGQVSYEVGGLRLTNATIPIPPELQDYIGTQDLRHPYFWSSFTLIGSPW